jgi:hypothetical protein
MMRSTRQPGRKRAFGTAGAVFVEFLIVFFPVLTMFLCLVQLGLLYTVRVVVEHAAVNAARTAAVVIGDKPDPNVYAGTIEPQHQVKPKNGPRYDAIRRAALLTLAPFIVNGSVTSVELEFPPPDQPGGPDQTSRTLTYTPMQGTTVNKVRVRLVVEVVCKIGLADKILCGRFIPNPVMPGIKTMRAEAMFPYQGARYIYP